MADKFTEVPLLSIVVPVKGNYNCLLALYEQFSRINSSQIEMIVHDNTEDNSEMLAHLKKYRQNNIKYFHMKASISMSDNFDMGIQRATGEYVCILGADDTVTKFIVNVAQYMKRNGIESAIVRKAFFAWPGITYRVVKQRPALQIAECTGRIDKLNSYAEFMRVARAGAVTIGKMPEPYHGIVSREVLTKVHEKAGTYVPGACPDMAMAIALSFYATNHIYIDLPIVVSGHSVNSAGGKGAKGLHKGELKQMKFLPKDVEKTWPPFIPKIWLPATIYADSFVSALNAISKSEECKHLNIPANYANVLAYYPEYWRLVASQLRRRAGLFPKTLFLFILNGSKRLVFLLRTIANKAFGRIKAIDSIQPESSFEAALLVERYFEDNNLLDSECLVDAV